MRIVAALDSFKGSISSMEAGNAVKAGILKANPQAAVTVKPLADGGEGTMRALTEGLDGHFETVTVTGPLREPVQAVYGIIPPDHLPAGWQANTFKVPVSPDHPGSADLRESQISLPVAILEMAEAAGITLTPQKDPIHATTRGVGEMILHAIDRGCRRFIIGIGGSATNDGGTGMLRALGYSFLDRTGRPVPEGAAGLAEIAAIKLPHKTDKIRECYFLIACDVQNPLCGPEGATYIYGPQKGIGDSRKASLDAAMAHYAACTAALTSHDYSAAPGAGAAGGLGFAFLSHLPSRLQSGVSLIIEATGLEESIRNADYLITGEGRLDLQTVMGKAPIGAAALARRQGVKVIALTGSIKQGALSPCNQAGLDACFSILPSPMPLEQAMLPEKTKENLTNTAEQLFRLLR